MDVHLSLAGKWVPCKATQRACPRAFHFYDTTPAAVNAMPQAFVQQLLQFQDPPTEVLPDGTKQWRNQQGKGMLHRDHDLPAIMWPEGSKLWYQHGSEHRKDDKPSYVGFDGTLRWSSWGNRHRENDLPAVIKADGTQVWYQNDHIHREDGPAAVYPDGSVEYYWEGYKVTKRSHAIMRNEKRRLQEEKGSEPTLTEIAEASSEVLNSENKQRRQTRIH